MTHLTQHTAVGGGDTLDGADRAVGVEGGVHGRIARQVNVLGSDLTVLGQLANQLLGAEEAALAVGDRHGVDVTDIGAGQPGGLVGADTGADQLGLVAADDVVGQGGAGLVGVDDLTEGHQTQLDESLEAVADTQHQTVAVIQQVSHLGLDGGIAEEGGNELGGAVGLVAAREAAGDEDHIGLRQLGGHSLHAPRHVVGGEVADDHDLGISTRTLQSLGGIVLAVGAGEHGDQGLGTGTFHSRSRSGAAVVGEHGKLARGGGGGGVDTLQRSLVEGQQLGDRRLVLAQLDYRLGGGHTQLQSAAQGHVLGQLCHNVAVEGQMPVARVQLGGGLEADLVTEGHLHDGLGKPVLHGPSGLDLPFPAEGMEGLPGLLDRLGGLVYGSEEVHGVACLLELGGQDLPCLDGSDGEGDQRGRNVLIQEGTRHGVLTADGGGAQLDLGIHGTQQSGEGLAPAGGLVLELLEELLEGQVSQLVVGTRGHQLGHGIVDGGMSTAVGVNAHGVGIQAPCHDAGLVGGLAGQSGQEGGHSLGGGLLGLAAEGHEHRARADGAVEALHKTSAGSGLEVSRHFAEIGIQGLGEGGQILLGDLHLGVLVGAVGVEEGAGEVGDGLALPAHDHAGLLCDHGHAVGLQVLALGVLNELVGVLGSDHNGHTLLGLGDGQLGAV